MQIEAVILAPLPGACGFDEEAEFIRCLWGRCARTADYLRWHPEIEEWVPICMVCAYREDDGTNDWPRPMPYVCAYHFELPY